MPKKLTKKTTKKTVKKIGLSFESVVDSVSHLHTEFLRQATRAVNASLTLRNWFIGAYIHEYELRGADRAKYGENPVPELADTLTKRGIPGCDVRELYRYRQFFRLYPQIFQTLSGKLRLLGISETVQNSILGSLTPKLQLIDNKGVTKNSILGSLTPKSGKKRTKSANDGIPQHSGDDIL